MNHHAQPQQLSMDVSEVMRIKMKNSLEILTGLFFFFFETESYSVAQARVK